MELPLNTGRAGAGGGRKCACLKRNDSPRGGEVCSPAWPRGRGKKNKAPRKGGEGTLSWEGKDETQRKER